jgi:eukaryotic-like serine/threonine-protein kinase
MNPKIRLKTKNSRNRQNAVEPGLRSDEFDRFMETSALEVTVMDIAQEESSQPRIDQRLNRMISHYKLLEVLGSGGMATVYKAEDTLLGWPVALKLLNSEAQDLSARERFVREAKAAYALHHPNICRIYSIESDYGQYLITMELLEGKTLKQHMSDRTLNMPEILSIAHQIAGGLDAAHSAGVIHRDIKPANIFITSRGEIKILDFGMAKLTAGFSSSNGSGIAPDVELLNKTLTDFGTTPGTVAYMSPEQALGEELDARTDLFSLGVIMYEMSTGRLPFSGKTLAALFDELLNREPVSPVTLNEKVPSELERIIKKALMKKRELRYQSATELIADVDELNRKLRSVNRAHFLSDSRQLGFAGDES